MLKSIDEDEKVTSPIHYSGQVRNMYFLTEEGLYEILMQSRKPISKAFKKEVKQILKTIRRDGGYIANTYMMVNTCFGALPDSQKQLVKGLFLNIEEQQKTINEQNIVIEQKDAIIEEQKPITFVEKITATNEAIKMREVAKLACNEG